MAGGGLQLPTDDDYFNYKGGGGNQTPYQGPSGGGPGSTGTVFGPGGGGSSGFLGLGIGYDPTVPAFGFRRRPFGGSPYSATGGAQQNYGYGPGQNYQTTGAQPAGTFSQGLTSASQGATPTSAQGSPFGPGGFDTSGSLSMLNQAGNSGVFDPTGSQALLQAIGNRYQAGAGAQQNQIRNSLMASGTDDPNAYAYGTLLGDQGLSHDLSQAGGNAMLQSMLQNQGFLQNQAAQRNNWLFNDYMQGTQQRFNQMNMNAAQGNPFSQILGSVGGAALGSIIPGLGNIAGGALGSLFGGGSSGGGGGAPSYMENPDYGWGGTGMAPMGMGAGGQMGYGGGGYSMPPQNPYGGWAI